MTKYGAVVVSYNSASELEACVTSFTSQVVQPGDEFIVCVVDNASADESVTIAKQHANHVIANEKNLGFSKAVNQGLHWLLDEQCGYVLILNPDAIVSPDAINTMQQVLDSDSSIGAVGPRMINHDGSDANAGYYLKAPSLLTVTFFSTHLRPWALKKKFLTDRYEEKLDNEVAEVDQIPGAAIFTSRQKLESIGLLSEAFAIWFEDVEWSYRARRKGYKMVFVPDATFVHEGGVSFSKWNNINKAVTFYVSMKTFFRLHKPLELPLIVLVIAINAFVTYLKNHDKDQLRFIKRFILQKTGQLPN